MQPGPQFQQPDTEPSPSGEGILGDPDKIESWGDVVGLVRDALTELGEAILARMPLILVGLVLFVLGVLAARAIAKWTRHGLRRTAADESVVSLTSRLVRFLVVVAFAMIAFSVAGVNIGAALATLGLAGLALAFALQNILENFVSGMLLLIRKPFRPGDQIRTGEFEGTVDDIDFRVTRLTSYDGELLLIPNADVFRAPLTNLTRRSSRRSIVSVGIDYRDDHVRAHEVLLDVLDEVRGIMNTPEPRVEIVALGESAVEFELLYWTLPDIRTVRDTRDRVLTAVKTALEDAGMTIPWPIRTIAFDNRLELEGSSPTRDGAHSEEVRP